MERIENINISIPVVGQKHKNAIIEMFSPLENIGLINSHLLASEEKNLKPKILLSLSDIQVPSSISMETDKKMEKLVYHCGFFLFGFNLNHKGTIDVSEIDTEIKRLSDKAGGYIKTKKNFYNPFFLTPQQLLERFRGKIVALEHVGINFGPKVISTDSYFKLRSLIAKMCNLYKFHW